MPSRISQPAVERVTTMLSSLSVQYGKKLGRTAVVDFVLGYRPATGGAGVLGLELRPATRTFSAELHLGHFQDPRELPEVGDDALPCRGITCARYVLNTSGLLVAPDNWGGDMVLANDPEQQRLAEVGMLTDLRRVIGYLTPSEHADELSSPADAAVLMPVLLNEGHEFVLPALREAAGLE